MKNIYKINGLRIQFGRLPAGLPALLFIIAALFATPVSTSAQSGLCDPTVPFFTVDLTASPNATWTSPVSVRTDNCCGTTSPDRCLEFEITVNPGTIAINFDIASGAVPPGAMFYQIDCGPPVAVGTPICLTGTGPFTLTFCKPGNNPNTYAVTAIPEPTVGPPVYASSTCPASIWVQGLVPGTITWTDVTGGGIYNSYLSCTNCASPVVTPAAGHPAYVDYVVCGTIAAGACNGSSSFCDTVRVNMFDPIAATVNPNPAFFCPSDPGVQLTGSHTGGFGNVVYTWYNSSWAAVGSGTGYFATAAGTYYLVVTDDMSASCPADTIPVVVSQYIPPILISPNYAGICEGSSVTLTASGADSYVWAPTTGLSPSTGPVVVASPATTTTYTVTGTDSHGCTGSMSVLIDIFPLPAIEAGPDQEICLGESAQLQGSGAFSY
ncbi:MAG TPA: hypothetical protein PLA88_03875, partial [Bacteroidales bacterium]|nr:hypothetical protein [Bacteroidales bacterium]